MSQPAVSKHLRVLRDAGLVEVRPDAQRRLFLLNPTPLAEIDAWLVHYNTRRHNHSDFMRGRTPKQLLAIHPTHKAA